MMFLIHILMSFRKYAVLLVAFFILTANKCPKDAEVQADVLAKIAFDYSAIDDAGLRNGQVAVDYEFCIPATDQALEAVLKCDQEVRVMQKSKGRMGCTEVQWLCINSTHARDWKEKLYAIASLDFVQRIQETVYE